MIKRESVYTSISMERRFPLIMKILLSSNAPMSPKAIAIKYIDNPTSSDILVTGTILNVLALAKIVRKSTNNLKAKRTFYRLET